MNKKSWQKTINKQLEQLDMLEKAYDPIISTLSDILEQRDLVFAEYLDAGSKAVVVHTNKGGAENLTKNPLLVLWDELNKTALSYWRELGLTPSSYKKITGDSAKKAKVGSLAEAIKSIEK